MPYLGIDVHSQASVGCLLDEDWEVRGRGKVATTAPALRELVAGLPTEGALRVGQEVGTLAYRVHDAVSGTGVEVLSFNAHPLRRIASSRKKNDRRDAYWVARALQGLLVVGILLSLASTVLGSEPPALTSSRSLGALERLQRFAQGGTWQLPDVAAGRGS